MGFMCRLGKHSWDGCHCSACGKTRDHDWRADCERCSRCGEERNQPHQWQGCKCSACDKTRDESHEWSRDCEECSRCGKTREGAHEWDGTKCKACGKAWDLDSVLEQLGSTEETEHTEAISELSGITCSSALVDDIAKMLSPDNERTKRKGAAIALGILGDSRAVVPLCRTLDVEKESGFLLGDVFESLRDLADQRAVESLTNWLISLNNNSLKVGNQSRFDVPMDTDISRFIGSTAFRSVIRTMGVLRNEDAVPYLIIAMQAHDSMVSDSAINALGEMTVTILPTLMTMIDDPDLHKERRAEAIKVMSVFSDSESIETLMQVVAEAEFEVKSAAIKALGMMMDQRAFDFVLGVLNRDEYDLGSCVADVLGEFGHGRAIEPLRKALDGGEHVIRTSAAEALAKLNDPSGADLLAEQLDDDDMRKYVAQMLAHVGDPRAYELLEDLLSSSSEHERANAAIALGRLGDQRAIPRLAELCGASERQVAVAVDSALAMLGDMRGFDNLARALWQSGFCDHEQLQAIEAMGRSGDPRALAHLVRLLRGSPLNSRRPVIKALVRLGPPAVDALLAELTDDRPIVRLHAIEALHAIGDSRVAEMLMKLSRDDGDEYVRAAASAAGQDVSGLASKAAEAGGDRSVGNH